jgi:hypothetical protein
VGTSVLVSSMQWHTLSSCLWILIFMVGYSRIEAHHTIAKAHPGFRSSFQHHSLHWQRQTGGKCLIKRSSGPCTVSSAKFEAEEILQALNFDHFSGQLKVYFVDSRRNERYLWVPLHFLSQSTVISVSGQVQSVLVWPGRSGSLLSRSGKSAFLRFSVLVDLSSACICSTEFWDMFGLVFLVREFAGSHSCLWCVDSLVKTSSSTWNSPVGRSWIHFSRVSTLGKWMHGRPCSS